MIIAETTIPGAFTIRPTPIEDERGFFARIFCLRELSERGIDARVVQSSVSSNRSRGTLRGMHYQVAPHLESKLVSCVRGSIYDVIVDLRPNSPSYRRWLAFTLSSDRLDAVFVPAGCAHGFITLEENSIVRYEISEFYAPAAARGIRFDDPTFGIEWPLAPTVISARDLGFPPYVG